ncbi:MAG TPA: hypothetical protein VJK53_02795 [Candidatus Paceibacterota bacterium]
MRIMCHNFFWFILFGLLLMAPVYIAEAATVTWTNGGGDGLWSTDANWSSGADPTTADTVVFNSTSVADSTVDAAFAGTVDAIQMNSGYTGTTTLARDLTIDGTGGYSQSAGTFDISGFTLALSGGGNDFTLSGGTYRATSATTTFSGNGVTSNVQVLTCSGTFPGVVDPGSGQSLFTLAAGCTVTLASTVSKTGFVTLSGDATLPISFTDVKGISIDGNATALPGTTIAITGQNGTNPSLTVTGSLAGLSNLATTTFSADFGATTFTCTGTWPGVVNISDNGSFTSSADCDFTLARSISKVGSITINGDATALSGSTITIVGANGFNPTFTVNGSVTGLANLATTTFSADFGISTFTCNSTWPGIVNLSGSGSFVLSSGCNITLASSTSKAGSITLDGDATVPSGSTITMGTGTGNRAITVTGSLSGLAGLTSTTFSGDNASFSQTLTCSGTWPGVVNVGTGASPFILSANCIATLSGDITKTGSVTINGTLDLAGYDLSASSITAAGTSTLRLIGNESMTGITPLTCMTVEYYGTGSYASLVGGSTYGNVSFTGSGTYSTASDLTVYCNFNQSAGTTNLSGTIAFSSTTVASIATTSSGTSLANLTLNKSGNTLTLAGSGLSLSGDVTITAGALDVSTAGCSSASCNITLGDDWSNADTFTARSGTVTFNGSSQSITGTTTFNNLTKTVSSADTWTFGANQTQTVGGTWTATGQSGALLSLRSSVTDTQWKIDPQSTRTISYLDVKDSNNTNATAISVSGLNITNSLNNTNWAFNATPGTPSSLGPATLVDGSWTTDTTPTVTFTTSDSDGDNVRYHIQVDDSSDFSSPVVEYISASAAAGSSSFTVGQAAGSGSYVAGSASQTLSDTSYYWRVRAGDTSYATSSYATANSGAIAYKVDATAPTTGSLAPSATTTSSLTLTISGASDAGSGLAASPYLFFESTLASSTGATSATSWVLRGLTPNTQYSVTTGVTDTAGNTATTSAAAWYTLAEAPASAAATADSDTTITVAWSAGDNPAGTEYRATNTTTGAVSNWITTTSYSATGLVADTAYTFGIIARNGDAVETATSSASATTDAAPSVSGGRAAQKNTASSILTLVPASAATSLLIGPSRVMEGDLVILLVYAYSTFGTRKTSGGDTVAITVSGENAAFPTVIDNGNGTYTARYISAKSGIDVITATMNGKMVQRDTDSVSDGTLHITVAVRAQDRTSSTTEAPTPEEESTDSPVDHDTPAEDATPPASVQPFTLEHGLTTECYRAFSWNRHESAFIYRTIGEGHEARVATVGASTPWYIDVDPLSGADITYRFVFARQDEQTLVVSAEELERCALSAASPQGEEDTGAGLVHGVIEQDIDKDGNNEQYINGVFQDTDGSSVPIAVVDDGLLIDTTADGNPDVYWKPATGASPVILAGDRLIIADGDLTAVTMYELPEDASYSVFLRILAGGNVALAAEATSLDPFAEPLRVPPPPLPTEVIVPLTLLGMAIGALLDLLSYFRLPFSLSDLPRLLFHAWINVLSLLRRRRRRLPWGTVYDSVTKAPLDPAYVELFDASGKRTGEAFTDLDGRYGFLVIPGKYTMRATQTHYAFPSARLLGRSEDAVYTDLYAGGSIDILPGEAVVKNIPLDPTEADWNQAAKQERRLMSFSTLDPYILRVLDVLFWAGSLLVLWELIARPTSISVVVAIIYALLVVGNLFAGRPQLWGSILRRSGTALSYGLVRFMREDGSEILHRVLDAQGRYIAILPKNEMFTLSIETPRSDGQYERVFATKVRSNRRGMVSERVIID